MADSRSFTDALSGNTDPGATMPVKLADTVATRVVGPDGFPLVDLTNHEVVDVDGQRPENGSMMKPGVGRGGSLMHNLPSVAVDAEDELEGSTTLGRVWKKVKGLGATASTGGLNDGSDDDEEDEEVETDSNIDTAVKVDELDEAVEPTWAAEEQTPATDETEEAPADPAISHPVSWAPPAAKPDISAEETPLDTEASTDEDLTIEGMDKLLGINQDGAKPVEDPVDADAESSRTEAGVPARRDSDREATVETTRQQEESGTNGNGSDRSTSIEKSPISVPVPRGTGELVPVKPRPERRPLKQVISDRRETNWARMEREFTEKNGGAVAALEIDTYTTTVQEKAVGVCFDYIGFGSEGPFDHPPILQIFGTSVSQIAGANYLGRQAAIIEEVKIVEDIPGATVMRNLTTVARNAVMKRHASSIAESAVDAVFERSVSRAVATQSAADILGIEIDRIPFSDDDSMLTDSRKLSKIIDESKQGLPILARTDHIVTYTRTAESDPNDRTMSQTFASMLLLQNPEDQDEFFVATTQPISMETPPVSGRKTELGVLAAFDARAINPRAATMLQRLMDQESRRVDGLLIDDERASVIARTSTDLWVDMTDAVDRLASTTTIGVPMVSSYRPYDFPVPAISSAEGERVSSTDVEVLPNQRHYK